MHSPDRPVRISENQLPAALDLISAAMQHDPMPSYLFADAAERQRRMRWYYNMTLRYGFERGEVLVTPGDLTGVAISMPSEAMNPSIGMVIRLGMYLSAVKLGSQAARKMAEAGRQISALRRQAAPERFWYLTGLSVKPGQQGQGIGGQLMQAVLHSAEAQGRPVYAETLVADVARFNARHGFKTIAEGDISGTGMHVWMMVRE